MTGTAAKNDYRVYADGNRHEMLEFVPLDAKRILDVGCSVGNFGELLKQERGAEVWGVEPDPEAAAIAETKLDKVICGLFGEGVDLPKNHFDCIVFNDVLEHMVDPYSALEFSKALLSETGHVVASIPNVRYFDNVINLVINGSWEYTDIGLLDRTHLRFFTRSSIEKMFTDLGYAVKSIKGISAVDWCHPHRRQLFRYLNFALANRISEMRWLQFAVVAFPAKLPT